MEIIARNVNEAFTVAWHNIHRFGEKRDSRNGPVLEWPGVFTTIYRQPQERVLFHKSRDANPFFHLFESMWMLAGRNDVMWLVPYNKRMLEYSDDGVTLHGAYGHRWSGLIGIIINMLANDKNSRRAYLPLYWPADLGWNGKDIPCNVGIDFKIRNNRLDMTVFNRSNDVLWGAYGANVVHFSILHECVANTLKVDIGRYSQVSTSFHIYTETDVYKKITMDYAPDDPYEIGAVRPYHEIVTAPGTWEKELNEWFDAPSLQRGYWKNPWLNDVLVPMHVLWASWKGKVNALIMSKQLLAIQAEDWRKAAEQFLQRRLAP